MTPISHSQISCRETAIGQQARTRDVAGFGTCQVGNEAGDLVCIAITLKGSHGNQRPGEVAVGWIRVGINRAGLDVVNSDAAWTEVSGNSLGEASDRCFCE